MFNKEVIVWLTLQTRLEMERIRSINSYLSNITGRRWRSGLHECCAEQFFCVPTVCHHLECYRDCAGTLTPAERRQQNPRQGPPHLHCHFRRIPTKCVNILLNPMKCQTLCKIRCYNVDYNLPTGQPENSRSHSPRLPTPASLTS